MEEQEITATRPYTPTASTYTWPCKAGNETQQGDENAHEGEYCFFSPCAFAGHDHAKMCLASPLMWQKTISQIALTSTSVLEELF